MRRGLG